MIVNTMAKRFLGSLRTALTGTTRQGAKLPDVSRDDGTTHKSLETITQRRLGLRSVFDYVETRLETTSFEPKLACGARRLSNTPPTTQVVGVKVGFKSGYSVERITDRRVALVGPDGCRTDLPRVELNKVPGKQFGEYRGFNDEKGLVFIRRDFIYSREIIFRDGSMKIETRPDHGIPYDLYVHRDGTACCYAYGSSGHQVGMTELADGSYLPDGASTPIVPVIARKYLTRA